MINDYKNESYLEHLKNREQRICDACNNFLETNDLFRNITEVAIMLSNLCNYATIHKRCPASCTRRQEIVSGDHVRMVLKELADIDYSGIICFHIYNEPTMDPRLFMFIKETKEMLPKSNVMMYTNGIYLNKSMMNEFHEIGMDIISATAYGEEEFDRLIKLDIGIPYHVIHGNLDDRMDYYDRDYTIKPPIEVCRSLLVQIPIYSDGELGLCCLDYKHPYKMGNVFESGLKTVLSEKKVIDFQRALLSGDRSSYPICDRCGWAQ